MAEWQGADSKRRVAFCVVRDEENSSVFVGGVRAGVILALLHAMEVREQVKGLLKDTVECLDNPLALIKVMLAYTEFRKENNLDEEKENEMKSSEFFQAIKDIFNK